MAVLPVKRISYFLHFSLCMWFIQYHTTQLQMDKNQKDNYSLLFLFDDPFFLDVHEQKVTDDGGDP